MYQIMIMLLCLLPPGVQQHTLAAERGFPGTWHGTSTCVDRHRDTACKDEEVVYVVKGIPSVRDTVEMEAFKIINGQRVSMGILSLAYSQDSHVWSFELVARVHAVWTFQVNDSTLHGTLAELPSKRLIRKVHATRINELEPVLDQFIVQQTGRAMRRVVFAINITADGYCGHTDGIADEELHQYFTRVLRNASTILFGRITYQLMVPYWPDVARHQSETEATNEFARVFDALDKVVFSSTLNHVEGANTRIVRGNVTEEVLTLKQQPGKDICIGSLSIASQLSARGLIDEYHFVVHPVVAGKGPRLFETVKPQERIQLDLIGSQTLRSGVVALHYRRHT